jgi:hypothetical protein
MLSLYDMCRRQFFSTQGPEIVAPKGEGPLRDRPDIVSHAAFDSIRQHTMASTY